MGGCAPKSSWLLGKLMHMEVGKEEDRAGKGVVKERMDEKGRR